ncbi:MAG: RHS repeat-associated core domain-containing protein [Betaproteobacteria bacterium]|nr:RHS repeat-associated core domain-containing protein [Betaproteobacteria bacterium]
MRLVTTRPDDTLTSLYFHPDGKGKLFYEHEQRQSDGRLEHKHYIQAGAELVGVYVTRSDSFTEMRYYHHDHLGSVAAITNEAGAPIERLAYEAFGERRYPNGNAQDRNSPLIGITTDRGFTSHEHLDELNLIHMNGRVYDPVLGRFMTADPFIQAPGNLQSYNRYSYVLNNPLAYTDPSGYFSLKKALKNIWKGIKRDPLRFAVSFAVSWYVGGMVSDWLITQAANSSSLYTVFASFDPLVGGWLNPMGQVVTNSASSFAGSLISSNGNLRTSVSEGFLGGLSGGINGYLAQEPFMRVLANSAVGGLRSTLNGGNFYDGFRGEFGWSMLTYANVKMRELMVESSLLDKSGVNDGTGLSRGLFDWFKLGGGRFDQDDRFGCSNLGCRQNGPGSVFGIPYPSGGFVDMIVEAFAGPHDFANAPMWYGADGSIRTGMSAFERGIGEVMNYTTSLAFATPFALAAVREQTSIRSIVYLKGK